MRAPAIPGWVSCPGRSTDLQTGNHSICVRMVVNSVNEQTGKCLENCLAHFSSWGGFEGNRSCGLACALRVAVETCSFPMAAPSSCPGTVHGASQEGPELVLFAREVVRIWNRCFLSS